MAHAAEISCEVIIRAVWDIVNELTSSIENRW